MKINKDYIYNANNCNMKPKGDGFLSICCNNCGRRLERYYVIWCPICEPPKKTRKNRKDVLNLIQIKRYFKIVEPNFNERLVWEALCEYYEFSNDSTFRYGFGNHDDPHLKNFDNLLAKYFKIDKTFNFEVSW